MLHLFSYDLYCFLDSRSTISYETHFVAMYFGLGPKTIFDPFSVSTSMVDSIVARKIYRGRMVSIFHRETLVDLVDLDMVNFNVILWMDWLHSCYES